MTITMDELLTKLKTQYPDLTLSRVHLSRVVRDINITLKQTRLRHVPKTRYKKPIIIKTQIKEFYSKIKQHSLNNIICIDKTSLNSFMIRRKCYEELGKRCVVKTESQEVFKKYTGIFAISSKAVIGYEVYKKGGIDSNRMVDFINKFINGKYKNKLIVLDNASSHRNQLVKDVIKNQIKEFYSKVKQYSLDDIICIDETSLNSFMIRRKCYEELGKRCVVKTESQEVFKKYTGIFAISTKGVIGYEVYKKGGIDSNRMINFINKFINGKYKNKLIILDNASSHRNQLVKDVIKKDNNLLYAVPYQHYTNAIEGYFNVLKSRLQKKKGLTYDELVKNVKDVLD